MSRLLHILLKKTKINKAIYKLLKQKKTQQFYSSDKDTLEAETLLQSVHQDSKQSCCCKNEIASPQYDLQIVVPAYNVSKYITQCMDSIVYQKTKYSFIVKVVDDGSTDNTALTLKTYESIKNVCVIHQENKGFSGARNTALGLIEAKYVMFVDSDDYLLPEAIEALMSRAEAADADIVEGSSYKFLNNHITKRWNHEETISNNGHRLFGFAWGKVYKAEMFRHVHFPKDYWFEDTVCALILHPMAQKITTTSKQVYAYRTNFKGISRNFRGKPKVLDSFYITRQLMTDRLSLNLPMDKVFAHQVAWQMKFDAQRITSLHREDINKAVFMLQHQLIKKYFGAMPDADDEILSALLSGDYFTYKLQVQWL